MRVKQTNILSGPILKGIVSLSLPIMVMNIVQVLFTIVDMIILKNFDTTETAVGAIGACGTLITFISNPLILVSAGATVVVAKSIGERNKEQTERAVGTSVAFSLACGIFLLVIGICFAQTFLRWTNCPDTLLRQATLYFQLYFAGAPLLLLYNFCAAILRAAGDSQRPMTYLIIGGLAKLLCNYICIALLDLSVLGAGISTVLSWGISTVLSVSALTSGGSQVQLNIRMIRFYRRQLIDLLRIGIPAGIQEGLITSANVVMSATVNSFGPSATTGISIANNFDAIIYHISIAPAFAVLSYVSQNIGAGNIKRATKSVGAGILTSAIMGASIGGLFAIFSREFSSLLSIDPQAIAFSQQKQRIISSTYFICGINDCLCSALRSMGKATTVTVVAFISMCIVRFLWIYLIFPLSPSITWLYLVWPISWIISICLLLLTFFPALKKLKDKYPKTTLPESRKEQYNENRICKNLY